MRALFADVIDLRGQKLFSHLFDFGSKPYVCDPLLIGVSDNQFPGIDVTTTASTYLSIPIDDRSTEHH